MAYEDLLKDTTQYVESGDYYLLTITDLDINTSYPIQFRWKYKDGRFSQWSSSKTITTPGETQPGVPSTLTVANNTAGYLEITWNGNNSTGAALNNIDRVDVYIDGAPFDATKAAASFFTAGTKTIVAPAGTYIVSAYSVSKAGTKSAVNTPVTRTVVSVGEVIQTPTLPSGITVATAPFAVSVNWPGTYSSSSFTGFKSIDIYAVSSDLGSTTTSGISSTNLVGSLTVQDTANKINIGLDNLKQALGLANTAAVYSSTIFYYFNASNKNGTKYGSPTYTRINSSSVVPTQANYVDLANGVISIENLVAGNGSFSSWLRTGTSGGARIELSAVSDFLNGGNTVQKGLVAYTSGNTELFNLDLDASTLTINGSGTFTGNLSIGSSNAIFKAEPATGIWLGDATYASAPFRVSTNGVIRANSGTIGGWTLASNYLQGTNFQIHSGDSTIYLGNTAGQHIRISSTELAHYNSTSTTGKFTLTASNGNLTIGGTITASNASLSGYLSAGNARFGTDVSGTNDGIFINANNYWYDTGAIKATSGTIGGWYLAADNLSSVDGALTGYYLKTDGTVSFGLVNATGFQMGSSGALTMGGGTISGASTISATGTISTSGTVSGSTLTATTNTGTVALNVSGTMTYPGAATASGSTLVLVATGSRVGYVSSSRKTKKNIEPLQIGSYTNLINQLDLVSFDWIDQPEDMPYRKNYGLIAEDVALIPQIESIVNYNDQGEAITISYDRLTTFLAAAVKELSTRLDALEG